jgi:hypothetical protein
LAWTGAASSGASQATAVAPGIIESLRQREAGPRRSKNSCGTACKLQVLLMKRQGGAWSAPPFSAKRKPPKTKMRCLVVLKALHVSTFQDNLQDFKFTSPLTTADGQTKSLPDLGDRLRSATRVFGPGPACRYWSLSRSGLVHALRAELWTKSSKMDEN